jgi:type IV secretory pathway ATPase VirB11/archaellum biosynthesis ATPase
VFPQIWEVGDFCMDEPLRKEISDIFRQNKNLVVFGRPGEGKTSFVSALCHAFYSTKRVLFFEDCEEIPLAQPRWVRLLKSQPDRHTNAQQQIKDQVKSSLRLRPDAFVFGETRDEEDIQNFCNARFAIPSTCLTTFHATDEKTSQCRWKALGGSTNGIVFLKVPARKKLPRKT